MRGVEFLILGGGPTGLGAASLLQEKGREWCLLEARGGVGGLASSRVDDNGFTWDLGGHVEFSHYDKFDRYVDSALGSDGWLRHQRESWVWIRQRFVPYPFQNNLHRLDPEDRERCLAGLVEAAARQGQAKPENFAEWMAATMGPGITELFLRPYNRKVWGCEPESMDYRWIGERVSVPGIARVRKSIETGHDDVSWGPNRVFRFPKRGGTGAIWSGVGGLLPAERMVFGAEVVRIDPSAKMVETAGGEKIRYRFLISTIPLNHLIRRTLGVVETAAASMLRWSSTTVVGVGLKGRVPDHLRTKCWMYFPEGNSPYYRVTVFSNYSPDNVPKPGEQWSLMTETTSSADRKIDRAGLVDWVIRALHEDGLLPDMAGICSVAEYDLPQAYPTPFLGRDGVVDPILRRFEEVGIFSRGRFGAWKYEVANQDHSFAQGYECAERLVAGGGPELEPTLFRADWVNGRRNP